MMAQYKMAAPDGVTYQVEGPDGANDEQVRAEIISQNPHLSQSAAPKEKPLLDRGAEFMFGEGVRPNAHFGERANRIATAATAGALMTGGIGMMAGGPAVGLGGLAAGGLVGGASEAIEQIAASNMFRAGRAAQVLHGLVGGMAAPGLSGATIRLAASMPTVLGSVTGKLFPRIGNAAKAGVQGIRAGLGMAPEVNPAQKAVEAFTPNKEAADVVGKKLQATAQAESNTAIQEAQRKAQFVASQKSLQAKEAASKQSTEAEMRKTAGEQESALREQEVRSKEGLTAPPPTEELGAKIQSDVVATSEPLYKARSDRYDQMYREAVDSASNKEAVGSHFANTKDFSKVDKYWRDQIEQGKMTEAQSVEIEKVLNEIKHGRGNKPIKDEWGQEIDKTPSEPKTLEGVDAYIRLLGDKAFMDAEGGKAIGVQKAKELRQSLLYGVDGGPDSVKGGLYAWEPKLQEAKAAYRDDSEGLKAYRTQQGKNVTAFEQDVKDRPKVDAIKVPEQYFKSAQGVKDLTNQLGGDSVRVGEYATQHAIKQLEGKDAKATAKWIDDKKQDWMNAVPGLRDKLGKYQSTLAKAEEGASANQLRVEAADKAVAEAAKLPTKLEDLGVKDWSTQVDKKIKQKLNITGLTTVTPTDGDAVLRNIFDAPQPQGQLNAIGYYFKQSPEAMGALPETVRDYLSNRTPKATMAAWDDRVLPSLKKSGLLQGEGLDAVVKDVAALKRALAKDKDLTIKMRAEDFTTNLKLILARNLATEIVKGEAEPTRIDLRGMANK